MEDRVSRGDTVKVSGQIIEPQEPEDFVFITLNKPVGVVSTTENSERNNIVRFVGHSTRIFPIGRLDKDSQGLIFLTNNGDIVNKILRAGNDHEKEYLVEVNNPIFIEEKIVFTLISSSTLVLTCFLINRFFIL